MKLLPIEKLSLEVGGWGVIALLTFFFHWVGFGVVMYFLLDRFTMFMFVYENTKDVPYDSDIYSDGVTYSESSVEDWQYISPLGPNGEGSLRTNLPESKG